MKSTIKTDTKSRVRPIAAERLTVRAEASAHSLFWDAWAPHHAALENNYLDVPAIRGVMAELREPVLVVGGGQGLIVAEIRKVGLQCDGIDLSSEMIRHAKLRRGIDLIHADARAMPFSDEAYESIVFATGVIDSNEDENAIKAMLRESRRVVRRSGKIFVAFYRLSAASENFMRRVGLLKNETVALRESLELYLLNPFQMVSWVAKKSGLSHLGATLLLMRMATLRTRKIFRKMDNPKSLIEAAQERQPYRNQAAIQDLFERLAIQVKQLDVFASCYIARIQ